MANNVTGVSSVKPVTETFGGGLGASTRNPNPQPEPAPYRLTIEEGPGGFVYKMRDQITGEVIRQMPREDVLKLKAGPSAGKGVVFQTRV
ncbi:MAG: flagellar protein FlaG [Brevundimonas sp.]